MDKHPSYEIVGTIPVDVIEIEQPPSNAEVVLQRFVQQSAAGEISASHYIVLEVQTSNAEAGVLAMQRTIELLHDKDIEMFLPPHGSMPVTIKFIHYDANLPGLFYTRTPFNQKTVQQFVNRMLQNVMNEIYKTEPLVAEHRARIDYVSLKNMDYEHPHLSLLDA